MNLAFLFARPAQEENLENLHCQTWPSFLQGRLRRMIWSICKKDYQTRPSSLQVWLRMMIRSLWKRIEWTWLSLCKTSSGGGSGKFALLNVTTDHPLCKAGLGGWSGALAKKIVELDRPLCKAGSGGWSVAFKIFFNELGFPLCKASSGGGSGKFALSNVTILFARPT